MDVANYRDNIEDILSKHDTSDALDIVMKGPKDRIMYLVEIGLHHLAARMRADKRRTLRNIVHPEFKRGKTIGSVTLTEGAKRRLVEHSRELFTGWMINADISLGNATREDLLTQAHAERMSARGHIQNAEFYEALAEPLKAGQRVSDYWKGEAVVKIKQRIFTEEERV